VVKSPSGGPGNAGAVATIPVSGRSPAVRTGGWPPARSVRWLAVTGVIVAGLSMRLAVTSVSPLFSEIQIDVGLSPFQLGVLASLPPVAFGIFCLLTPRLLRRRRPEAVLLTAMAVAGLGQVLRALGLAPWMFLASSFIALGALGVANAALPTLIKKHFPDRLGVMTTLFVFMMTIGTAASPQLAVPVAEAAGWRISIAAWAGVNLVAIVPWALVLRRTHVAASGAVAPRGEGAGAAFRVTRSRMAWGLAVMYGCTITQVYTTLAWLPTYLVEAGVTPAAAGSLLALYAYAGLPLALLMPAAAVRLRNPYPVVLCLIGFFVAGYAGLLAAPDRGTWLWVLLIGLGPGAFPLSMTLINLRARTAEGAAALSGFSQGIGFAIASAGPFVFGLLREVTGAWQASFGYLTLMLLLLSIGAYHACRPGHLEPEPDARRPTTPSFVDPPVPEQGKERCNSC
jgi:MFS transporter, CP family, cyanate transporter